LPTGARVASCAGPGRWCTGDAGRRNHRARGVDDVAELAQDLQNLSDVRQHPLAFRQIGGDAFFQNRLKNRIKLSRREQVGKRTRQQNDVFGLLLDLARAFKICDRRGDIFDANPEQRRNRNVEQFRQSLERIDLRQLTALEAIQRGPRDSDAARDILRAHSRRKPEGAQALRPSQGRPKAAVRYVIFVDVGLKFRYLDVDRLQADQHHQESEPRQQPRRGFPIFI